MSLLDPREIAELAPAETSAFPAPIPTQFVSSDEFLPGPQTENQRRVEARIKALGSQLARHQVDAGQFQRATTRLEVEAALGEVHLAVAVESVRQGK